MKFARPLLSAAVLACAATAPAAWAQEADTTFNVLITIESTCSIDTPAATDVDFGTVASTATAVQATGTLSVNCTPGTEYDIALDAGANSGGDITARAMTDGTTLVPYQLYQDAGRTAVWGDTIDVNTVAGTGTGAVEEYEVYGLVPSASFPAGSYIDTVTATVTY